MYAIGLMAFVLFLSSLVSLPVLPRLSAELGADTHEIPIVVSAALATVVVAQFFAGSLADRFSRKRLILLGAFLGSVSSLLCVLVDSWVELLLLRVLGGVADAISMPALLAITSTLGKDTPGRFFGILRGSQGLSFVAGPAIGSALSLVSLRTPFLVDGIMSLVAFGAGFALIQGGERAASEHHLGVFRGVRVAFGEAKVFLYLLLGFAALFAFGILVAFVPTKGNMIGLQAWEIGLVLTSGSVAFSLSSYLCGVVSDRTGRRPVVVLSLAVMIGAVAGLVFAREFWALLVFYTAFSLTEAIPYLLSFVYASEAFEKSYIGTAMGAFDSLMDLSLLIAPVLGISALGLTQDMTYPFLIAIIPAVVALACSIGWLRETRTSIA